MSIEKLKAELQKMQNFDEKTARDFAIKFCDEFRGSEGKCVVPVSDILVGARFEHTKHARTAQMLIEAVETLEFYAKKDNWTTADEKTFSAIRESTFPKGDSDCTYEPSSAGYKGGRRARETLTKLAKGAIK